MQRRQLASRALAGAAIAAALPIAAEAKSDQYRNVVFTADDPGHFADMVGLQCQMFRFPAAC